MTMLMNDSTQQAGLSKNYYLCSFVCGLYFCATSFFLLFPKLIVALGGSEFEVGFYIGITLLPFLAMTGFVRKKIIQIGPKNTALLGLVLYTLCSSLYGVLAPSTAIFYVNRLTQGVGHMVFMTGMFYIILLSLTPEIKVKGIALFAVFLQVGAACGIFLADPAYSALDNIGYTAVVCTLLIIALIVGVVFLDETTPIPTLPPKHAFRWNVLRPIMPVLALAAGLSLMFGGVIQFMPTFLQERSVTFGASWFIGLAFISNIIGRIYIGRLIAQKKIRVINLFVFLSALMALQWIPVAESMSALIITAISIGLAFGVLSPQASGFALKRSGQENQILVSDQLVLVAEIGFRGAGLFLAPVIFFYDYKTMFYVIAITLALLGLVFVLDFRESKRMSPEVT